MSFNPPLRRALHCADTAALFPLLDWGEGVPGPSTGIKRFCTTCCMVCEGASNLSLLSLQMTTGTRCSSGHLVELVAHSQAATRSLSRSGRQTVEQTRGSQRANFDLAAPRRMSRRQSCTLARPVCVAGSISPLGEPSLRLCDGGE
jgi:hypothetical protein